MDLRLKTKDFQSIYSSETVLARESRTQIAPVLFHLKAKDLAPLGVKILLCDHAKVEKLTVLFKRGGILT